MAARRRRRIRPTVNGLAAWATGHEDLCTERYDDVSKKLSAMDKKIDNRHDANVSAIEKASEERRQGFKELRDDISALKQTERTRKEQEAQEKLERTQLVLRWVLRLGTPTLSALILAIAYLVIRAIDHAGK